MEIKQMLLTYGRGGRPGKKLTALKGVVIHWTANTGKGANAVANRNYFENNPDKKVSAHYIVDSIQIVQCIPDDEVAYHVGATSYKAEALSKLGSYPNAYCVGIEMCVNSDGDFNKTYANTVQLAAYLLNKYGLTADNLWRHYDVTGKDCPKYFADDATAKQYGFASAATGWKQFKEDVKKAMEYKEVKIIINGKTLIGYNIDGTTYAPVRALAETLNKMVIWDNNTKTVIIK